MTLTAIMPLRGYHGVYLRKALNSIFSQTSPNWRLLIVAEPSDCQNLRELLRSYLRDPRVGLIANEGRMLAGALNTGMRHADTDFAGILSADDMWVGDAVSVLAEHIRSRPGVDFFHSARMIVDEHDRAISSVHPSRESVTLPDFGLPSPVKHLLCWRTQKGLSVGGMDESLNSVGPDDFDFPWTMAEHGAVFGAIPDCLYLYRDHRSSFRLTTHLPRSLHTREMRRIMSKHGVGRLAIERNVWRAKRTYLRQCLHRSPADRWVRGAFGPAPRAVWRETYR